MNVRQLILWKPSSIASGAIFSANIGLVLLLGFIHFFSGLDYDFQVFYSLPVLLAAWYLGFRAGLAIGLLSAVTWLVTVHLLSVSRTDSFPLLFNSTMRLASFAAEAWILALMRNALDRESRLARVDALTGLSNRREFFEQGRRSLALAHRNETPFTAAFIDLDRFKQVNDELGHEAGDALLVCVADVMRAHLRVSDNAGRLGGDEFALLLPGMDGTAALTYVEDLRQRLLTAMRDRTWPVTFSIGIASHAIAPDDLDLLLADADKLMYAAKESGRDRILKKDFHKTEK